MTFSILIDVPVWAAHLTDTVDDYRTTGAAVVPVIKSRGYGLGTNELCVLAAAMQCRAVAVGNPSEAISAAQHFGGEIVVLEPFHPYEDANRQFWMALDQLARGRVIKTIADRRALNSLMAAADGSAFVLEGRTTMGRFGFTKQELVEVWQQLAPLLTEGKLVFHGLTVHPPFAPDDEDFNNACEMFDLVSQSGDFRRDAQSLWVSHFDFEQLEDFAARYPHVRINFRTGTGLWLGERDALHPNASILGITPVKKGDRLGYHQNPAPGDGWVVTASGGTTHGIGLQAPVVMKTFKSKIRELLKLGERAFVRQRSPFWYNQQSIDFLEPPHQHASMLFIPNTMQEPKIGDELGAEVRFTITRPDVVVGYALVLEEMRRLRPDWFDKDANDA